MTDLLRGRRTVVLTGAGCSTESGRAGFDACDVLLVIGSSLTVHFGEVLPKLAESLRDVAHI